MKTRRPTVARPSKNSLGQPLYPVKVSLMLNEGHLAYLRQRAAERKARSEEGEKG